MTQLLSASVSTYCVQCTATWTSYHSIWTKLTYHHRTRRQLPMKWWKLHWLMKIAYDARDVSL